MMKSLALSIFMGAASANSFEAFEHYRGVACRGDHASDNSDHYYRLSHANSLSDCESQCRSNCFGIEYNKYSGRCELWTREIKSGTEKHDFICAVKVTVPSSSPSPSTPFKDYEGAACRGDHPHDNSNGYYRLSTAHSLSNCQSQCRSGCFGVEFNHVNGRCELWTRGIYSGTPNPNFVCSVKQAPEPPKTRCSAIRGCEACTNQSCNWAFPTFGSSGECMESDEVCDVRTNPSNDHYNNGEFQALVMQMSVICAKTPSECAADNGGKTLVGNGGSCTVGPNIFDECKYRCSCEPEYFGAEHGYCKGHCVY